MKKTPYFRALLHAPATAPATLLKIKCSLQAIETVSSIPAFPSLRLDPDAILIAHKPPPSTGISKRSQKQPTQAPSDIRPLKIPVVRSFTLSGAERRPRANTEWVRRKQPPSLFQQRASEPLDLIERVDFQPQKKVLVGERKLMRGLARSNTCITTSSPRPRSASTRLPAMQRTSAFMLCPRSSSQSSRKESALSFAPSEAAQEAEPS